jgi:UDPglucose--hexose-1-phosphate uridylyltransferase
MRHVQAIDKLTDSELAELAAMYQRQAQRYDILFHRPSPNITVFHNAPCDDNPANSDWCFHIVMQPPLRDSSTLKYFGGYEQSANNIVNPVQPEMAAAALRECTPSAALS